MVYSTCDVACWEAKEDVCRCMCGGRNHGIMRYGGPQPGRYCQRKGVAYRLEAIYAGSRVWQEADKAVDALRESVPRISKWGYDYVDEKYAFAQPVTPNMLKWPEVKAVLPKLQGLKPYESPGIYLVWVKMESGAQGR